MQRTPGKTLGADKSVHKYWIVGDTWTTSAQRCDRCHRRRRAEAIRSASRRCREQHAWALLCCSYLASDSAKISVCSHLLRRRGRLAPPQRIPGSGYVCLRRI